MYPKGVASGRAPLGDIIPAFSVYFYVSFKLYIYIPFVDLTRKINADKYGLPRV